MQLHIVIVVVVTSVEGFTVFSQCYYFGFAERSVTSQEPAPHVVTSGVLNNFSIFVMVMQNDDLFFVFCFEGCFGQLTHASINPFFSSIKDPHWDQRFYKKNISYGLIFYKKKY